MSFLLILAIFWTFWFPGVRVAPDLHLTQNTVQTGNILPMVWKETAVADGLGEYYAPLLSSQALHVFFGLLALFWVPFEFQIKVFGFLIIITGFLSIRKLLSKYEISEPAKTLGAVFFLLNTFFILLFDGGQLSLTLSYALLPLAVYYLLKNLESDELKNKLKFAASSLALSVADIRIVYLLLPVVSVLFFLKVFLDFKNLGLYFKRFFFSVLLSGAVLVGFHAYWLLPVLKSGALSLPETYGRLSQIGFLSFSSMGHSLLLQQPHWPQNVFGRLTPTSAEFIFIPLLVFWALSLVKRNIDIAFWSIVALSSIFLSKGSNDPFGQVYPVLFKYLPGFSFFRDPSKFYFLISISYSILLSFTLGALKKFKFLPLLVILYLIVLARPVWLGEMSGLLSEPYLQKEFMSMGQDLEKDKNFSRVLWISSLFPLGYVSPQHPAIGADRLSLKRPFAVGRKGTYETYNFLREAPFMGEIFDVAGIGYIAYPYLDPKRDNLHPDNIKYYYTFLDQLSKRPWLSFENSGIPFFKTKEHQDRFFITPKLWWVLGSDSIYNDAIRSAVLKLSKNALIFTEEYAGMGTRIDEVPEAKIILNNKTELDLAAGFLNPKDLIFPAQTLKFDPDKASGWWKREAADLIRWRSFLQEKYGINNADFDLGGGWGVVEGARKLKIENGKLKIGKTLLARVMESSRSGNLMFYQGGQKIGEVTTGIEGDANVRWFEAGKLTGDKELTIASSGNINVVNALAILDSDEWILFQDRAKKLRARIVNFEQKNAQNINNPKVSYERINPTKYKIKVVNLTQTAFLVFSQNYDSFWKMGNQTPLPVYSLLNGFRIDHDGDYTIEYEPQKYVYFGLVISGITIFGLILFFLKFKKVTI